MGADMWAAEILLRMKEQQTYQDVELCLALPFEGYDSDWDDWHRKRMDFICRYAEKVLVLGEMPSSESYKKRNYYMVEQAGHMIAVYDNAHNMRSGTQQTVNYAKKKGLQIIYIDTAGAGTGRVDRTAPIRKEDAGAVRDFCLEHIDREAFLSQWFWFAVTEQEILYSFDGLTLCPEVAGQTVGVQTLHHDTAFDIAAARPALTAGKGKLVFGADWLDLIHDFFVHFVPP